MKTIYATDATDQTIASHATYATVFESDSPDARAVATVTRPRAIGHETGLFALHDTDGQPVRFWGNNPTLAAVRQAMRKAAQIKAEARDSIVQITDRDGLAAYAAQAEADARLFQERAAAQAKGSPRKAMLLNLAAAQTARAAEARKADAAIKAAAEAAADAAPTLESIVAEHESTIENRAARAVRWNTGRAYTAEGQPMAARIVGGWAYFQDSGRSILGKIEIAGHDVTRATLESFVMAAYDAGRYAMASHFPSRAEAEAAAEATAAHARAAEAEAAADAAEAEAAQPVTLDLTPTWAGLMPALIAALQNGTAEGQTMARAQLMSLAAQADAINAADKAERQTMAGHAQSIGAGRNTDAPQRASRATARAEAEARAARCGMAAHALRDTAAQSGGFPLWACNAAPAIDESLDLFSDYGGPFDSVRYGVGLPEARETIATRQPGGRWIATGRA